MKPFAAIVSWDGNGRVTKMQDYDTLAEAQAHGGLPFGAGTVADTFSSWFATSSPNAPIADWKVTGGAVSVEAAPVVVTPAMVIAERERRLALGFDYDFGDGRGVHHIGTTEQDMKGWDEVSKAASALVALGQVAATLDIVTDTGPATVTVLEWQGILVAAATARQPIWAGSFALQAMSPIPADYATNAAYWGG